MQVCGVYGSWHLGQLQVGLSRAIRLAQCRSVRITALEALPVQIDGEPWHQPPAILDISLKGQVRKFIFGVCMDSEFGCSLLHIVHAWCSVCVKCLEVACPTGLPSSTSGCPCPVPCRTFLAQRHWLFQFQVLLR